MRPMLRRRSLLLLPAALVALALADLRGEEPPSLGDEHAKVAAPFLKKHCFRCHDEKERSGDVVLLDLSDFKTVAERRALWRRAARQVAAKEMPPEEEPQPDAKEREAFVAWVKRAMSELPVTTSDPGRVTVRRLNRAEWAYTIEDLLRVKPQAEDDLPADDTGYGFDRIGDVLSMPPLLLEKYLAAAEHVASMAILDWKAAKTRVPAAELQLKDTGGGDSGAFKVMWSNGRAEATVKVPATGEYVVRIRAYGDQAGSDKTQMAFVVDRMPVANWEVAATAAKPEVYEKKVKLEAGERKLGAAFTNDYYKPNDPDPKQRDRNLAVEWIELDGPTERPPLPWAHQKYFKNTPTAGMKPAERRGLLNSQLSPVAGLAWRRPATAVELERLGKLVDKVLAEGESWERALQHALQAILVSPAFLFRLELEATAQGDLELLDERALATRLSYFIWSSLPDDELIAQAQAGTLRKNLDAQVKRLLEDPKASRLTAQFAVQWLQLRRLESIAPDTATYPSYDAALPGLARQETEKLFETVLRENRSVRDLVDADFTFVNGKLARLYGIDGVSGDELQRVKTPEARRGLLGHASVLMATSNPTRTSPVKRGRWVLDVLLDDPPPPPLPGADSLKEEGAAKSAKTLREKLEQHRAKKECASCHAKMDALGFALERFDGIGKHRDRDGEDAIDDAGSLADGTKLAGATGLREWLGRKTPRIARAVAKKLMIFGLGRGPIAADEEALDAVVEKCAPDYKLQDMIVELTKLDAFQKRRGKGKQWR